MTKLNSTAAALAGRYIRKNSTDAVIDTRKKRGLQAEINKLDAIRKTVLNSRIDEKELLRFRTELNKLMHTVDERCDISGTV